MMKRVTAVLFVLLVLVSAGSAGGFPSGSFSEELIMGTDIGAAEINDFYYTYSTSTNPPFFQRYRFYQKDGAYYFYHETREGGGWPQTEEDITVSGTAEITEEDWSVFFSLLIGGSVHAPAEDDETGSAGPWMYVYRENGQEEFEFPSYEARDAFEAYCEALKDSAQ